MGLIKRRLDDVKVGELGSNTLLDLMLEPYINGTTHEDGGSKKVEMRMKDILEECKLFTLTDWTTSALMSWTMVALAMHPVWQDRARAEVLLLYRDDQIPTFDGLNQLNTVSL